MVHENRHETTDRKKKDVTEENFFLPTAATFENKELFLVNETALKGKAVIKETIYMSEPHDCDR